MKKLTDISCFLLFFVLISGAATSVQAGAYEIRNVLVNYKKPTKKRLLWAAKDAPDQLINLATDRNESKLLRVKAIESLVLFKNNAIFQTLRVMIFDSLEPNEVRAAAMRNIGLFHDRNVVGILKQFILSKKRLFRLNAVRGLAVLGTFKACSVIRAALTRETDLNIKIVMDRLYSRCNKGGAK